MTQAIPRIDRLEVTNFQSIEKASIELGAFTVVVGPSNSGKSALLRALRAVSRNEVLPSSVRVGKTMFTATVTTDDKDISIERGKSHSVYRVTLPTGHEEVFTKSGRTVPDDVQKALSLPLPEGPDLVFSSQIDPPFLLKETGTTAAKMLGDLTNVSKLHDASREANRRRLEASRLEKIRTEDAIACATAMKERFSDLPAHNAALKDARALLESVKASAAKRDKVSQLLSSLEMIDAAERDIRARLDELPVPADIDALSEKAGSLLAQRHVLLDHIEVLRKIAEAEETLVRARDESISESEKADQEYHEALKEAGTCPTCSQKIA